VVSGLCLKYITFLFALPFHQSPGLKSKADAEDAAKEKEEAYIESLESTTAPLMLSNKDRRKSKFLFSLSPVSVTFPTFRKLIALRAIYLA